MLLSLQQIAPRVCLEGTCPVALVRNSFKTVSHYSVRKPRTECNSRANTTATVVIGCSIAVLGIGENSAAFCSTLLGYIWRAGTTTITLEFEKARSGSPRRWRKLVYTVLVTRVSNANGFGWRPMLRSAAWFRRSGRVW